MCCHSTLDEMMMMISSCPTMILTHWAEAFHYQWLRQKRKQNVCFDSCSTDANSMTKGYKFTFLFFSILQIVILWNRMGERFWMIQIKIIVIFGHITQFLTKISIVEMPISVQVTESLHIQGIWVDSIELNTQSKH